MVYFMVLATLCHQKTGGNYKSQLLKYSCFVNIMVYYLSRLNQPIYFCIFMIYAALFVRHGRVNSLK